MKQYLEIKADPCDADYITEVREISEDELKHIRIVAEAIKKFEPYITLDEEGLKWRHNHNFPTNPKERLGEVSAIDYYVGKGLVSQEDYDVFVEFIPYDEHLGIHTVTSIRVMEEKEVIL
jgi:hypothetical protein